VIRTKLFPSSVDPPTENQRVSTPAHSSWYKSKMRFSSDFMVQIKLKTCHGVENPPPPRLIHISCFSRNSESLKKTISYVRVYIRISEITKQHTHDVGGLDLHTRRTSLGGRNSDRPRNSARGSGGQYERHECSRRRSSSPRRE